MAIANLLFAIGVWGNHSWWKRYRLCFKSHWGHWCSCRKWSATILLDHGVALTALRQHKNNDNSSIF